MSPMSHTVSAEIVANVLSVDVAVGDTVGPLDSVVLLESMKMEIPVLADVTGTVVEIVVALDTDTETVDRAKAFVEQIGKRPIETKDRSGFIVNMLLVPYLMAAVRMFEDDFASREDIDMGMMLGCGHTMGPLALCDFLGLDVLYAVCDSMYKEFKRDEYAPPPLMKRMLASGRLGRKSGRGFYEYE